VIVVQDLRKCYGRFEAVQGLTFHVRHGEVFGFLGPNGAGKTTTMRIIAGLIQPTSGQVLVDGHDLQRDPLAAKAITGFIPDRPFLYEKLTAFEMLELVGGLHQLPRKLVAERGEALLQRFELADWADSLVESFSHGMKQRLVFATALLPDPRLLVVDEPMVGLDPRGARLVKAVLRERRGPRCS
jgi:ABC-2 type transport system ATP-binding protein